MKLAYPLLIAVITVTAPSHAAVLTNTITARGSSSTPIDPFLDIRWKISTVIGDASLIREFSYNGRLIATTFTIGISHHGFSAVESIALPPSYAAMATPFSFFLTNLVVTSSHHPSENLSSSEESSTRRRLGA
jgi:hypothetical protein